MELASASGRNILLTGPTGCGKTSLINDFLDKQGDCRCFCFLSRVHKSKHEKILKFMLENYFKLTGQLKSTAEELPFEWPHITIFIQNLGLVIPVNMLTC